MDSLYKNRFFRPCNSCKYPAGFFFLRTLIPLSFPKARFSKKTIPPHINKLSFFVHFAIVSAWRMSSVNSVASQSKNYLAPPPTPFLDRYYVGAASIQILQLRLVRYRVIFLNCSINLRCEISVWDNIRWVRLNGVTESGQRPTHSDEHELKSINPARGGRVKKTFALR